MAARAADVLLLPAHEPAVRVVYVARPNRGGLRMTAALRQAAEAEKVAADAWLESLQ